MIVSTNLLRLLPKVGRHAGLISLICLVMGAVPGVALSGDDLLPPQLDDLKLGVSSAQITQKLKDFGTPERSVLKRPNRFKLSWTLKNSPYFKKMEFEFTEKDHLYLARFVLQDAYRFRTKDLKKRMFPRFGVSWEFPGKMRSKEKDIILYIPVSGSESPFFFEMTDTITGEKWFELFDRGLSARDRMGTKAKSSEKKDQEDATKVAEPKKGNATETLSPKEAKPAKEESAGTKAK